MEPVFDLQRLIDTWKKDHGTFRSSVKWDSPYYAIPIARRYELFTILVRMIKSLGKGEEYFTPTKRELIIKESIPPEDVLKNSKSYSKFKDASHRDLRMAIAEVYDPERTEKQEAEQAEKEAQSTKVYPEFDPSKADSDIPPTKGVRDPEMEELLGYKK